MLFGTLDIVPFTAARLICLHELLVLELLVLELLLLVLLLLELLLLLWWWWLHWKVRSLRLKTSSHHRLCKFLMLIPPPWLWIEVGVASIGCCTIESRHRGRIQAGMKRSHGCSTNILTRRHLSVILKG